MLDYDLPAEYKCAGRGMYVGRTSEPEGVAIVSGGGGGGGGPDCAAGADRRDDGPVTGTGPELRGGRKVSSSRQVTARRNRLHISTIFCSVLLCWVGVISWYWPILDEASDSIARMTSYCTEKVVTSYATSFFTANSIRETYRYGEVLISNYGVRLRHPCGLDRSLWWNVHDTCARPRQVPP